MHSLHMTLIVLLQPLWRLLTWIRDSERVAYAGRRLPWWSLALCLTWLGLPVDLWAHHGEAGQPGRSMRAVRLETAPPQAEGFSGDPTSGPAQGGRAQRAPGGGRRAPTDRIAAGVPRRGAL